VSNRRHYYRLPGEDEFHIGTLLAVLFFAAFLFGTIAFIWWKAWG